MNELELMKCVDGLASRWKSHFGLYTQYVGYMTGEMIISLLTAWRYSEHDEFDDISDHEINDLINRKIAEYNIENEGQIAYFPSDKDIDNAMQKLIVFLKDYDLSVESVSPDMWSQFIEYLRTKDKNRK